MTPSTPNAPLSQPGVLGSRCEEDLAEKVMAIHYSSIDATGNSAEMFTANDNFKESSHSSRISRKKLHLVRFPSSLFIDVE